MWFIRPECMVCGGGNVEHVFDPVGGHRGLAYPPVGLVVFPSAVPVDVEAEDVFCKSGLRRRGRGRRSLRESSEYSPVRGAVDFEAPCVLNESNAMALRITDGKNDGCRSSALECQTF